MHHSAAENVTEWVKPTNEKVSKKWNAFLIWDEIRMWFVQYRLNAPKHYLHMNEMLNLKEIVASSNAVGR